MHRDRKYLDYLRGERCIFTGLHAQHGDAVDPMHIGTAGKGLKSHDYYTLPALNSHHRAAHQYGEISYIRENIPDDVLRAAMRALAKENYQEWKNAQ